MPAKAEAETIILEKSLNVERGKMAAEKAAELALLQKQDQIAKEEYGRLKVGVTEIFRYV